MKEYFQSILNYFGDNLYVIGISIVLFILTSFLGFRFSHAYKINIKEFKIQLRLISKEIDIIDISGDGIRIFNDTTGILGRMNSLVGRFYGFISSKKNMSNSIAGIMILKKTKELYTSLSWLFFSLFLSLLYSAYYGVPFYFSLVIVVIIILFYSNHLLLKYRISKGYYGTNQTEAREFLHFLLEMDDDEINQGGRKIFPDIKEELEIEYRSILEGKQV